MRSGASGWGNLVALGEIVTVYCATSRVFSEFPEFSLGRDEDRYPSLAPSLDRGNPAKRKTNPSLRNRRSLDRMTPKLLSSLAHDQQ